MNRLERDPRRGRPRSSREVAKVGSGTRGRTSIVGNACSYACRKLAARWGPPGSRALVPDPQVARLSSGHCVVYLHEQIYGIPVFEGMVLVVCKGSRAVALEGDLHEVPAPRVPTIDPASALDLALDHLGVPRKVSAELVARLPLACSGSLLHHPALDGPVPVYLVWLRVGRSLRLGWRLILRTREIGGFDLVVAAAGAGRHRVLYCRTTNLCAAARIPVQETRGTTSTTVVRTAPLLVGAYGVASLDPPPVGFPFEWVDTRATVGPNVEVGLGFHGHPVAGALVADGAVDFVPQSITQQAAVNAFFWCNYAHDLFYLLGFDEAAGNYQQVNHLAAGKPGDPVRVNVFAGKSPEFAAMEATQDGLKPDLKLAMHPVTGLHAGLDAEIVLHEYAHAVTERLTGGRISWNVSTKAQSRALAEGLSDYFALSALNHASDSEPRTVFGAWVRPDRPTGLRPLAYIAPFARTFGQIGKLKDFREPHEVGQLWAWALFALSDALGRLAGDPGPRGRGVRMTWRIVLDSLMLLRGQGAGPSFLDARRAILRTIDLGPRGPDFAGLATADLRREASEVFRTLGMGAAAISPGADFKDIHEDFS